MSTPLGTPTSPSPPDEYFAQADSETRQRLQAIQHKVETLLSQAHRCNAYKVPAFRHERVFFYLAALKKHIGIYPPVRHDLTFVEELAPYRGPKGILTFSLAEPLPTELIGRVAVALFREYRSR